MNSEVFLDGAPDHLGAGIKQHGTTRFQAIDALVRTRPIDLKQHPIAHLTAAKDCTMDIAAVVQELSVRH